MVLIGDNGARKSSFLIALYQIIAGGLIEPQTIKNFALMYLDENRQIRIKTTLPETAIKKTTEWKYDTEQESFFGLHKSPYVIRYTESFDDQESKVDGLALTGDWADTCDIDHATALQASQIAPQQPIDCRTPAAFGFIEKAGTGTGEIVKLCLQHGLKKPLFEQDGDFKVIIWRPGTQDGTQDGTQKQLEEKIISLIKANPKISRKDIATATQTSPRRTIARRIKEMNDKIRFVGSGYSGHWEVIKNS